MMPWLVWSVAFPNTEGFSKAEEKIGEIIDSVRPHEHVKVLTFQCFRNWLSSRKACFLGWR